MSRRREDVLVIVLALATGCGLGIGSPFVGEWRPHTAVEFEVCVEDESGACAEEAVVTSERPARKFWGLTMTYPQIGYSRADLSGDSSGAFRGEVNLEFFRGKGRFAAGLRGSVLVDVMSDQRSFVAFPVMAMGHIGLSDRISLYVGAGVSPYNNYSQRGDNDDTILSLESALGGRGLGGIQLIGSRSYRDSSFTHSFELDTLVTNLEGRTYRSMGLSYSLSIFF